MIKQKTKYCKLADIIKKKVNDGEYSLGEKILTEQKLMEKYQLSRDTVRKAVDHLVKEKYLYKLQGSGTFVSEEFYSQSLLKFYSFTEEMIKRGKVPSSEIISFELVEADEKVQKKMAINSKEIYKLIRLRLADKKPVMYETTYLNPNLLKNLSLKVLTEKPLYDIIRKDYKVNFDRAVEKFKAVIPTEDILEKLKMSSLRACMELERYTYSQNEVLEYTKSIARGDKLTFEIELK
ncbi:MAG: GntR family transcriptional regulator [Psychrilyobacter sp.]|uniref:GntR family transcriptional regulator n=1 Tax=Psychrilyobacter sp. TaxID=2586924 RepID=UPI003C77D254